MLFSTFHCMFNFCLTCEVEFVGCELLISDRRGSFVRGEGIFWTAPTHPIFVKQQRQRPSTCSLWYTITSVVTGGTDWTAGQRQSIRLQWTRWTDSTGHTWTGHWPLQCPVWIHNRQDQQEQRVHLFNCCPTKTQTSLPVHRKSGWSCVHPWKLKGQRQWLSAGSGRCVLNVLLNVRIKRYVRLA